LLEFAPIRWRSVSTVRNMLDLPAMSSESPEPTKASAPPLPPPKMSAPGMSRPRQADQGTPEETAATKGPFWRLDREMNSYFASFLVHFVLLIALALAAKTSGPRAVGVDLIATPSVPIPSFESGSPIHQAGDDRTNGEPLAAAALSSAVTVDISPDLPDGSSTSEPLDDHNRGTPTDDTANFMATMNTPMSSMLMGRRPGARPGLVAGDGGTDESERAVRFALRWLMAHQREDGSWNFNHHKSRCQGQCRHPGSEASTVAATALALLPFLGAGHTHEEGEYQEAVRQGLYYLGQRALATEHGYDLRERTMYDQGLVGIVLCEAYAMTGDAGLRGLAQGAIDFIVHAQDPEGGGWRYEPGFPGDTTVTGWQLMALKSGQIAKLSVPSPTLAMTERFLDHVEFDSGAQYGYMEPKLRGQATTSIGLLCRMYTGWQRGHAGLRRGVALLNKWGPSENDMYYNYYATQVMHHWEGDAWEKWNVKMRDYLVATQATDGHESGSWYFPEPKYGDQGGRLYNTAMAAMILEVYYRHMPLYRQVPLEDSF